MLGYAHANLTYELSNDHEVKTMMVKQQLIAEIEAIDNPITLSQLFEILQLVKQNIQIQPKQKNPVMQFAGCLDDDDAHPCEQQLL